MNDTTVQEAFRALSIRQYWLHAILNFGKEIENRTWKPPQWIIGQRVALHASQQIEYESADTIRSLANLFKPKFNESIAGAVTGAILATAKIEGFVTQSNSRWFFGPYGWVLKDVYVLPEPYPCKGALGLWRVPYEIAEDIIFAEQTRGSNG